MNRKISIVVPVYGCPDAVEPLCNRIVRTIKKIKTSYEIILVNDSCPKNSWSEIEKVCKKDKNIIGINLSRNFGQIHATNAGIDYATGDYLVLMDCDLQDKPEEIEELYKEINKGFDIVYVRRKNRKDSLVTKFLSKAYYKIYNHFVSGFYDPDVSNYCIAKKKVVDEYKQILDSNKSFVATLCWMKYKSSYIDSEGDERFEGKSSYTIDRKIQLAVDMLTSHSNKPLLFLIKTGVVISLLGFIYLIIQIAKYFLFANQTEGWTSVIGSIFFIGGMMLFSVGGVGIYVGNIFNQTKGIPEYIVVEVRNGKK